MSIQLSDSLHCPSKTDLAPLSSCGLTTMKGVEPAAVLYFPGSLVVPPPDLSQRWEETVTTSLLKMLKHNSGSFFIRLGNDKKCDFSNLVRMTIFYINFVNYFSWDLKRCETWKDVHFCKTILIKKDLFFVNFISWTKPAFNLAEKAKFPVTIIFN